MPLEQVSEIRSRLVTSKSGKAQKRQFADYRCTFCGSISEKQPTNTKRVASCGCQKKRLISQASVKHGKKGTKIYDIWAAMIQRTTNPKHIGFKDYGGRGIRVCDRWLISFETFLEDMGERPLGMSIDRIDNSRGYEPGNCRWADTKTQNRNTRRNRILTIDGVSRCVAEWAEQPKAAKSRIIKDRLRIGWTEKEAVFGKSKDSTNVQ